MGQPFIIWAATRTASTTLSNALNAETEPFNIGPPPNRLCWVYDLWRSTGSIRDIGRICESGLSIKHMVEGHDDGFNVALAKAATANGYRHIHLVRLDTLERLISLDVAGQVESWWPEQARERFAELANGERTLNPLDVKRLVGNARIIAERWRSVSRHLGCTLTITCEDITSHARSRRIPALRRITRFLELPPAMLETLDAAMHRGDQDTRAIRSYVPNVGELRAAIHREAA